MIFRIYRLSLVWLCVTELFCWTGNSRITDLDDQIKSIKFICDKADEQFL